MLINRFDSLFLPSIIFLVTIAARFTSAADPPVIQCFQSPGKDKSITASDFSSNGSRIAIDEFDRGDPVYTQVASRIYDVASGKVVFEMYKQPGDQAVAFTLSPNGRYVLISTTDGRGLGSNSVRDLEKSREIFSVAPHAGYGGGFFSPDGLHLYLAIERRPMEGNLDAVTFAVVDLSSSKATGAFRLPQGRPDAVAPDGKRVISGMSVYEVPSGRRLCRLETSEGLEYFAAQTFLADSSKYRVANRDGVVFTWSAQTGKLLSRIEPQTVPASQTMDFSKGGTELIVRTTGMLFYYDAETLHPLGKWKIPDNVAGQVSLGLPTPGEIAVHSGDRKDGDLLLFAPNIENLSPIVSPMPTTVPVSSQMGSTPDSR
jgi:WD40 repeat protein